MEGERGEMVSTCKKVACLDRLEVPSPHLRERTVQLSREQCGQSLSPQTP